MRYGAKQLEDERVPHGSKSIIILEDYTIPVNLFHSSCQHLYMYFVSTSERLSETKSDQLQPTSHQGYLSMKWAVDGRTSMHFKSSVRDVSLRLPRVQAAKEPRSDIVKGTPWMLILMRFPAVTSFL